MRCFATHSVAAALGLLVAAGSVMAQGYGSPTLLPLPEEPAQPAYGAYPGTAKNRTVQHQFQLTNADEPTPAPEPVPSPEPQLPEGQAYSASPSDVSANGAAASGGCAVNGSCYGDEACDGNWIAPWCGPGCGCGWFGSVGGMVLTRDKSNGFWTSFESTNNANQIQNTEDADADWRGGWFLSFGKWFGGCCDPCGDCCGPRCGIEAVYFSTSPFQGFSEVFAADPLNNSWVSSTIDMNDSLGPIQFPDGNEVDDYFDNSLSQSISRRDYIQNVEINLLSQYWQPNAHCQVTWLGGIRWFRFDESLLYSATAGASTPTGSDQAFMDFDCTNDLVGFQLGARCDWYLTQSFSLFVTPKFGLYGNHIQTQNRVYNGDGSSLYDFSQDTTGVSFLGEIDIGTSWQFSQHWRAFIGYRAIAATGVALSDNQIPHFLAAADEFQTINRNGSLIIHGGFAGAEFCY
jgi:hypothetical protein